MRQTTIILTILNIICFVINCSSYYEREFYRKENRNENNTYRETLNFEKNSKCNLIVKIESEDNYELSDLEFNLSRLFPTPEYYEKTGIDYTFRIPIPYSYTLPISPSIQSGISYSTKIDLKNKKEYALTLPENTYYGSLAKINDSGIELNPIESKKTVILFGYSYDEKSYNKYDRRKPEKNSDCIKYEKSYNKETIYSCPIIPIENGKTTELTITIGKRKWNNTLDIFYKFIPGILLLGPFTNINGYYFYRDYQIDIKMMD